LQRFLIYFLLAFSMVPAVRAGDDPDASFYLWRLMNAARTRPLQTLARFEIDAQAAREALGAEGWILDQGLPPLAWNQNLFDSAWGHNQDMIDNLYYAYNSPDGTTVTERIAAAGYDALNTGESLGALLFDTYLEPMEAVDIIFTNMLKDELAPGNPLARNIFNPAFTEIGIALTAARLDLGDDLSTNAYVAVADFGQPLQPRAFLLGNVYHDPDGDGTMNPADAASGVNVVLRLLAPNIELEMPVGPLGAYQFELPAGFLLLEARNAAGQVVARRSVFRQENNQLVDLRVGD